MAVSVHQWELASRRRRVRYRVQAPVDVTVLRSGIPDTVPGRSVNLGEGGVGAVLAGELLPGESVGVEIRLPHAADSLRTRALVRHHDKLRYGMEFVGLSSKQQAAIRDWVGGANAEAEVGAGRGGFDLGGPADKNKFRRGSARPPVRKRGGRGWIFLLVSVAVLLGVLWWRWNRGWEELESGLNRNAVGVTEARMHVSADVMERLVTHRVDPDYPAAARPGKLRGIILLDVVVGRDGSVVETRALNGPEILAQAATDAMRWWRFQPYRVDGKPVSVETTVAMEFKP
jgi:TonB family protein